MNEGEADGGPAVFTTGEGHTHSFTYMHRGRPNHHISIKKHYLPADRTAYVTSTKIKNDVSNCAKFIGYVDENLHPNGYGIKFSALGTIKEG